MCLENVTPMQTFVFGALCAKWIFTKNVVISLDVSSTIFMWRFKRKAWSFTFAIRPQREAEFTPKGRGGGARRFSTIFMTTASTRNGSIWEPLAAPKGGGACHKVFDHIHDYSFNNKWVNLRPSRLPNWGGACLKVFDHIHDYGFKKKQLNLRASGLDSPGGGSRALFFFSTLGQRY